jgi:uncharacterized protein YdeI (YjbR/CyaY-like superfamily)
LPDAPAPILSFPDRSAWAAWVAEASAAGDTAGAWLRIARAGSGIESVTHAEALEVALCHGWIDGQRRGLDEQYWLARFTPRRPRSKWSKVNRENALQLIERGEMAPAGLREVERARADGRWEAAYDAWSAATVPDDLRAALAADPPALAFFEGLDARNRYAILYRIQDAKREQTRAGRIERFVAMCREGRTVHPPSPPGR